MTRDPSRSLRATGGVLLYDGVCGFCNRAVRFVLARDPQGTMRFAALQGRFAEALLARHPAFRTVDSLLLVHQSGGNEVERISVRSAAVLEIASYLGGAWQLAALLLRLVPRPLRDWAYDAFASRRFRLLGRYDACPVPPPEVRARFIE